MHDPRATGYKRLVASDPEEQRLRNEWYELRTAWLDDGSPDSGQSHHAFFHKNDELTDFLWKRNEALIAADRKKHPKARRNQPVPQGIVVGDGRVLP